MTATRTHIQTATALVATAASLAICGATLMARPLPAGAGPVGPAVASTARLAEALRTTTADPIGTTDRAADQAISTARTVRDDALRTAGTTVATAVATATQTVDTVGQVEAIAVETVDAVGTTALNTVDTVASLTNVEASAQMDVLGATGTISASAGDAVRATAELEQGKATVTVTGPILGTTQLTLTYGDDALFAPSTTAL